MAPDFELKAQDGSRVSLHQFAGSRNVVIYFYPKDFTTGCTAETKSFGENYDKIIELGAEVIGISSDSAESHREFANECGARFILLADEGGRVRKLYDVQASLGVIPGRVTYIIDKGGVIRHIFSSQLNARRHVEEALEALKKLPN